MTNWNGELSSPFPAASVLWLFPGSPSLLDILAYCEITPDHITESLSVHKQTCINPHMPGNQSDKRGREMGRQQRIETCPISCSVSLFLSLFFFIYVMHVIESFQKYLFGEDLGLRKRGLHDSALIIGFILL